MDFSLAEAHSGTASVDTNLGARLGLRPPLPDATRRYPLCAMGFHWAFAKMAWNEIGT